MYSIYSESIFASMFPFYDVLWYSHSDPPSPTDAQCSVSMLTLQCNMHALYGFETKG